MGSEGLRKLCLLGRHSVEQYLSQSYSLVSQPPPSPSRVTDMTRAVEVMGPRPLANCAPPTLCLAPLSLKLVSPMTVMWAPRPVPLWGLGRTDAAQWGGGGDTLVSVPRCSLLQLGRLQAEACFRQQAVPNTEDATAGERTVNICSRNMLPMEAQAGE